MMYNSRMTPWLLVALIVGMTGCQGRSRQTMVVERQDNSGDQQQAQQPGGATGGATGVDTANPDVANPYAGGGAVGGGDAVTAARANTTGKLTVNGWTGDEDEQSTVNWTVAKGSVSSGGATVLPSTTPTTTIPSGTATSAAVTYDGRILSVLSACTRCHGASGTNAPVMDTYDTARANIQRIIARSQAGAGMPPQGSVPAADLKALQDWQASGMQKSATGGVGAGGDTTTTPAGNGLVLEISDQRYGNYLNNSVITARVGQTLKIVNRRSQGGFIIHTNGSPFDHGDVGNPIPPGGSIDVRLDSPYQGEGDIYEHTDGSVNTDRLIKLQVTQ